MTSYNIKTKDNLLLCIQKWKKPKKIKGTICIIHGLGEHQNRYKHVSDFFAKNGFQVYTYDQRGHGQSQGKRGHTPSLDHNLDDLDRVLKSISYQKLFLYGHSFGGNVLANYLMREQPNNVKGAILSSAWLKLASEPNLIVLFLAKIMNVIVPSLTRNNQLDSFDLSNEIDSRIEYDNDPLTHNQISFRLFSEFYYAGIWAMNHSDRLRTNTLMIHGEEDRIISSSGTEKFAKNNSKYVDYKIFKNTKHEPHNDTAQIKVFEFTLNWITKNL